ncbi:hypothetical protein I302_105908 [Kwoniella bestiolae CBS 10118]|uniref:RING-type E3 ubiquitin transferase (cysteine targeting) n=1 Tax=Kwoniella bestiolae CBS 10118 TaxID=1296100 RepID=A0A1B9G2H9_9TREE|nr:hypothetical protein I302_05033 [Kwoniella bestiolae CBS 10118]OCF25220.1 hypothetical protein I302_05033 [Kwoniella bestiolae CBS 10118]
MSSSDRIIYPGESPSESSSHAAASRRALRVNQIDSEDLDSALVGMLSDKLSTSLNNFKSTISDGLKPELELVIKLAMFRYGIWSQLRASPGAKLQNLKMISDKSNNPTKRILLLYLLLHPPVFPRYLINRVKNYALSNQWSDLPNYDYRKKIWKILGRLESISRIWELGGWLAFLWDGKYPSLLMRILRLRLVPSQPHLTRLVSYEFMNRQLVWGAFTEFLMFSIPLRPSLPSFLNPSTQINHLKSILSPPQTIDYTSIPTSSSSSSDKSTGHKGIYSTLPKSTCPICYSRNSTQPVPLSSSSAGSNLTLPPIEGVSGSGFGHEEDEEDSRVFIPAQTDCRGDCRWCYYCIGGVLYEHYERVKARGGKKGDKGEGRAERAERAENKDGTREGKGESREGKEVDEVESEADKWDCLRCGGKVGRAWRVGEDGVVEE